MENNKSLPQIIAEQQTKIAELEALVQYYEGQLKLAKHRQFGSSSEKSELPEQLGLFDEAENTADSNRPEPELEEISYKRRKRAGKREDDLSGLPVEVIEHTLPGSEQICPECSGALHTMGHDTRRELEIIPATVKVVEHKRAVYSCRACERHGDHLPTVKAPMPEPVIRGSLCSPSALAHIMHQKYVMCVPLYRQEQAWLREGVHLSRQTMANWVIRGSEDWLEPIYDKLKARLLSHQLLHADETVCQVLNEPGKKANTNSYMWLYRTSGEAKHPIVLYEYQPTRSSSHPRRFLDGWDGYLHADGYKGYHSLPPGITIVGCWVHLRRKFDDVLKPLTPEEKKKSHATQAIRWLGELFHLESLWKDLAPEQRQKIRLEKSKPLAEEFFEWVEILGRSAVPKSPIGVAVNYALGERNRLMNFYLDGRCELSNNRAENSIRPFVMGRKNWLFCNSQKGAKASAVVYSIIETAKANELKPAQYLKLLFETVPNTTTAKLDELLPWKVYGCSI